MTETHRPVAVWLSFLEEWTEEARLRGAKSAAAYLKAHRSLSACEDPLVHPCETVRLRGIGDSIAQRIEKQYEAWCTENNVPMPQRPSASSGETSSRTSQERTATRRPRRVKTYVPEPRSGAHGILVGLYAKVLEEQDEEAFLGKTELIARAQPFCDTDYLVPGGGSSTSIPSSLRRRGMPAASQPMGSSRRSYMTAWQGMKTLIDKGYVYRSGNPARFSLSDVGLPVAHALAVAEGIAAASSTCVQRASGTEARELSCDIAMPPLPGTYESSLEIRPSMLAVQDPVPENTSTRYIQPDTPQLYLPSRTKPNEHRDPENVIVLDDSENDEMYVEVVMQSDDDDDVQITTTPIPAEKQILTEPKRIEISLLDSSPLIVRSSSPASPYVQEESETLCTILPPESYEICMILDHREVRVRSTTTSHDASARRITFEEAMEQRGIPCELRALEMGDILWVARPKPDLPPATAQVWSRIGEVVLDAVIERKRLDDLTSSIFDGRWHDQKLRLRQSGMGHIVYLIEDINVAQLVQRYGQQIQTALSSTQVIDGFYVHRTANGQATADFLAMMHHAVESMYKACPLHVLREEQLDRTQYSELQQTLRMKHPATRFHTSFHTYQQLHSKGSIGSTLQDLWTRMLLCIRGVSPEKAQIIVHRWSTPQALYMAYQACASDEDAQTLLCRTLDPQVRIPRRRIGPALSRRIWFALHEDAGL